MLNLGWSYVEPRGGAILNLGRLFSVQKPVGVKFKTCRIELSSKPVRPDFGRTPSSTPKGEMSEAVKAARDSDGERYQ